MEYPKEYGIEYRKEYGNEKGECRYGLRAIESCRRCLFETLCHLEHDKEQREKEQKEEKSEGKGEQVLDPNQ